MLSIATSNPNGDHYTRHEELIRQQSSDCQCPGFAVVAIKGSNMNFS
jgi:hypothetical protein